MSESTGNTPAAAPQTPAEGTPAQAAPQASVQYYEHIKKELKSIISQKRTLDKNLASLEEQIFTLEGQYLEDTAQGGNIIRGFENFLKSNTSRRRTEFSENDRLFSLSSASYLRTLKDNGAESDVEVPRTDKKKKKRRKNGEDSSDESDGESEATTKRQRISFKD
ncbi:NuA4-domain-containing protein [Saitoella complicata NRRL Y-17804]|nr:NuA4-domain-containing protein [Saitoella complicata NRRL Y-17804]ODQ52314.1 NuA4-domain-containing protein [Saitoella complicata NRRL Y-17804]